MSSSFQFTNRPSRNYAWTILSLPLVDGTFRPMLLVELRNTMSPVDYVNSTSLQLQNSTFCVWTHPDNDFTNRPSIAHFRKHSRGYAAHLDTLMIESAKMYNLSTPEEITAKRKPEPKKEGQEVVPLVYATDQLDYFRRTLEALPLDYLKCLVEDNYVLVAGPPEPKNLLGVRELDASLFCTPEGGWYAGDEQEFSRDEMAEVVWHAIRKDHVPNSISEPYEKQCGLLLPEEQVPTAVKVAWVDTTYAKVRGVRLHNGIWVRTSSVTADRGRVYVRSYSDGFVVSGFGVHAVGDVGVSASREVPNA